MTVTCATTSTARYWDQVIARDQRVFTCASGDAGLSVIDLAQR